MVPAIMCCQKKNKKTFFDGRMGQTFLSPSSSIRERTERGWKVIMRNGEPSSYALPHDTSNIETLLLFNEDVVLGSQLL